MLILTAEKRAKRVARFRWIQIEEVQDTRLAHNLYLLTTEAHFIRVLTAVAYSLG